MDGSLFKRKSDGKPLKDELIIEQVVPKQLDAVMAGRIRAAAGAISSSGQGAVLIFAVLSFFLKYGMNNVLGQVRSLQLITHLMMMQLNYPASSALFFGQIFEYVTFDLVPTDEIYGEVFDFDSEPYSNEAEQTGYESRLFIENTGSCLIFVAIITT